MRPIIENIVDGLLNSLEQMKDPIDLIQEYAFPIPCIVIAHILGSI